MGLIARLGDWLAPQAPSEQERAAIERVVEHVDPRLRLLPGYERKLALAVRRAMGYCDGLVAGIPGPIDISVRAFGADPLVHALFGAPGDIGRMLATSREIRSFIADPSNEAGQFYAMVGMRRKVKTMTGLEVHGDVVREGSPQRLLYFADHTVHAPSLDIETARNSLCAATLDSLAKSFAVHLADLRRARDDLRSAWEQERARAKSGGGKTDAEGMQAQHLLGLGQALRDAAVELEPGHVMKAFTAWLAAPEPRLRLEETSLAVNSLGVIADDRNAPDVQTLTLPELIGRDRRRWIVLLARISRDDALRAQQESAEATRYLVI